MNLKRRHVSQSRSTGEARIIDWDCEGRPTSSLVLSVWTRILGNDCVEGGEGMNDTQS